MAEEQLQDVVKQAYYHVAPDGSLLSTAWLTVEEAAAMPWLVTEKPPQRVPYEPTQEERDAGNFSAAKDYAVRVINAKRAVKLVEPIAVDGITIDADDMAMRNINAKIQEVTLCNQLGIQIPPEMLVWMDKNNQVQAFASVAAYVTWLQTVAIQLSQRGTMLYRKSWQDKAKAMAAISQEQVSAVLEWWNDHA